MRNISTREAANAYAPSFIADFNQRFGKPPKSDHNAHRPLRDDENLKQILACRVARKLSNALTVQYDRVMYLLQDTEANRRLIHEYVEVIEYRNGAIEIQAAGRVLPYREYDRITQIDRKHLTTAVLDGDEGCPQSDVHHSRFDGHHCDGVGKQAG